MDRYYKYRSFGGNDDFEHFVDTIIHSRLYGAKYRELNDPFEGRFTTELTRQEKDELYAKLRCTRVCSMMKKTSEVSHFPDDFQMWTLYGGAHNGYCIEFELTDSYNTNWEVRDIVYNDNKPKIKGTSDEEIRTILTRKQTFWERENEVRAIKLCNDYSSVYYYVKIVAIYFGLRVYQERRKDYSKIIRKFLPDVSLYRIEEKYNEEGRYSGLGCCDISEEAL